MLPGEDPLKLELFTDENQFLEASATREMIKEDPIMILQDLKRLTKELKALNAQLRGYKTKPQRQRIQRRAFQIIGQIERGANDR